MRRRRRWFEDPHGPSFWDLSRHTSLGRWLGLAFIPLVAGAICLYVGLVPALTVPEIRDAPTVDGIGGTVFCPSLGNEPAWAELEASTNPRDQLCIDSREEQEEFRSLMTQIGVGCVALGVAVLGGTLFVRSNRRHQLLAAELARRQAEAGLDTRPPEQEGPVSPIS